MGLCLGCGCGRITLAVITFSLFGVQVRIHLSLWVSLALMAFMLSRGAHGVLGIALFVIAGFLCIFAHEMGHALSGRWMGGGRPLVELAYLGGLCTNNVCKLSRPALVLMTAAGPLTSLAVALPVLVWFYMTYGSAAEAFEHILEMVYGVIPVSLVETYPPMVMLFLTYIVQVSVLWSLLNLLPIYPLDGGVILHNIITRPRKMHTVCMAVASVLSLFFLALGYFVMFFILLALILLNYHGMKNAPY